MTPELKEKWAAALESGEYTQATGMLRAPGDGMCCLGVLCHLVDQSRWGQRADEWFYLNDGAVGMPPLSFLDVVGLGVMDADDLAQQNDEGATFDEIAKAVRRLSDARPPAEV